MILCLDVGNTNLLGGVFEGESILETFRWDTRPGTSADEFGLFFRSVLRENAIDPAAIKAVGISSVVPSAVHSLRGAVQKYFGIEPFFLQAGVKTGLKITIRNPVEVGADRIANAVAVSIFYPEREALILDFGTATTCCAISAKTEFLGGTIMPGLRISMESLAEKTARLGKVEIVQPEVALGRSTVESIQSGLFFGHVGAMREISRRISEECFGGRKPLIVGTGGFGRLLEGENLFDIYLPNLALDGIRLALELNR